MVMSHEALEIYGKEVLEIYSKAETIDLNILPIEKLATEHLKLKIRYATLSSDGSIYGLTAYTDTEYHIETESGMKVISIESNQILLEKAFLYPKYKSKLFGKHRFTLAHEVAHQLLFSLESTEDREAYNIVYSKKKSHSVREIKTIEDWNEWQANVLASILLMPKDKVDYFMFLVSPNKKIISYDNWFDEIDAPKIKSFCELFGVSKTAAIIRLNKLGYIENKKRMDYRNPLDIVYG
ncbi:MAG: ImmA/IrrE family metallo-endopeptidase [Clostridia bacterium]